MKQLDDFINFLHIQKNCSGKTLKDYRCDIEQFIEIMSIESIGDITKQNIIAFLAHLTNNLNAQPATRNRKLTAIRSFCKYLCTEDYMAKNPAQDIPSAKIPKRLPKTISVAQTNNIIQSAEGNLRDTAALETLYGTACRIDELVHIKITDIDFDNSRVRLIGKGDKERIVPITSVAIVAICDYIGQRDIDSEYLFPGKDPSQPITTRAMYDVVRKYGNANGIDIHPHKFRHSTATHLLANGMDIRKIQELLGHSNINTTTVYAEVVIDQMAKEFHSSHPRG